MNIIKDSYKNININESLTITIGNFDGMHKGHQSLINEILNFNDTKKAVMTFSPHPMIKFMKDNFEILMTDDDKIEYLSKYDIDYLLFIKFDDEFSTLSKEEFIAFLKKNNVKRLILGSDFNFSKKGIGNVDDLKEHFEVIVMPDEKYNGKKISSSMIKSILKDGNIELSNQLLSHYYKVNGLIEHGNELGRTLGYNTANVSINNYVLPKNGVYYVKVNYDGVWHDAMANIGNNPSINYTKKIKLEIHIFNFSKYIYDELLEVVFVKHIREEIKFSNKDELIMQIKSDEKNIKKLSKNHKYDIIYSKEV